MSHPPPPVIRGMATIASQSVERARGAEIQILIGPADGAPNFITRRFKLAPGGRIPCHRHDNIEHEQVMLAGSMVIGFDDREVEVSDGDCIFIPARVAHWYENRSERPAVFLCMVPKTTDYQTEWLEPPEE